MLSDEMGFFPLEVQLSELETAYAECFMEADKEVLASLWLRIQEVKNQLGIKNPDNLGNKI
ncbi:hypothetical protein EPD60_16560 [Flaviaesturariibacter flavus]|uniref:Uncharacterized protein n=1 Tax=Flaviaesturariibacter flavus TaxID=2502780 RepID=A0A4R1B8D2_9BACT|nr:hypothetical protein [Flaviaesturariibacter flavus]TCJ12159.1 hypothetical protein EPD60_16560 [Flaviaesturariibacter flavus]